MNYYARAIEALNSDKVSATNLLYEIAKKNPKALADAFDRLINPPKIVPEWKLQAIQLMDGGQYVEAIKHCRNMTGLGLKEAKDACDAIQPRV